ncbi:hypothetical protein H696_04931 [Fonticula alba]|uniref:Uncharacterized protein n=1 Tax=Fonticula alba TaxID=691883 RepID=A0A058Z301_FONAL|nr:hypothetical protein H696_04931 [Fonticula alba]KCV68640.1 hypothetical protein H696_04931 [Fonticula alba]|eukprot:XP_009497072.1 hypothetical protein H696_04931 [Fonticula alba]
MATLPLPPLLVAAGASLGPAEHPSPPPPTPGHESATSLLPGMTGSSAWWPSLSQIAIIRRRASSSAGSARGGSFLLPALAPAEGSGVAASPPEGPLKRLLGFLLRMALTLVDAGFLMVQIFFLAPGLLWWTTLQFRLCLGLILSGQPTPGLLLIGDDKSSSSPGRQIAGPEGESPGALTAAPSPTEASPAPQAIPLCIGRHAAGVSPGSGCRCASAADDEALPPPGVPRPLADFSLPVVQIQLCSSRLVTESVHSLLLPHGEPISVVLCEQLYQLDIADALGGGSVILERRFLHTGNPLAWTSAKAGSPVLLVHGFAQNRFAWHSPACSCFSTVANPFAPLSWATFRREGPGACYASHVSRCPFAGEGSPTGPTLELGLEHQAGWEFPFSPFNMLAAAGRDVYAVSLRGTAESGRASVLSQVSRQLRPGAAGPTAGPVAGSQCQGLRRCRSPSLAAPVALAAKQLGLQAADDPPGDLPGAGAASDTDPLLPAGSPAARPRPPATPATDPLNAMRTPDRIGEYIRADLPACLDAIGFIRRWAPAPVADADAGTGSMGDTTAPVSTDDLSPCPPAIDSPGASACHLDRCACSRARCPFAGVDLVGHSLGGGLALAQVHLREARVASVAHMAGIWSYSYREHPQVKSHITSFLWTCLIRFLRVLRVAFARSCLFEPGDDRFQRHPSPSLSSSLAVSRPPPGPECRSSLAPGSRREATGAASAPASGMAPAGPAAGPSTPRPLSLVSFLPFSSLRPGSLLLPTSLFGPALARQRFILWENPFSRTLSPAGRLFRSFPGGHHLPSSYSYPVDSTLDGGDMSRLAEHICAKGSISGGRLGGGGGGGGPGAGTAGTTPSPPAPAALAAPDPEQPTAAQRDSLLLQDADLALDAYIRTSFDTFPTGVLLDFVSLNSGTSPEEVFNLRPRAASCGSVSRSVPVFSVCSTKDDFVSHRDSLFGFARAAALCADCRSSAMLDPRSRCLVFTDEAYPVSQVHADWQAEMVRASCGRAGGCSQAPAAASPTMAMASASDGMAAAPGGGGGGASADVPSAPLIVHSMPGNAPGHCDIISSARSVDMVWRHLLAWQDGLSCSGGIAEGELV